MQKIKKSFRGFLQKLSKNYITNMERPVYKGVDGASRWGAEAQSDGVNIFHK